MFESSKDTITALGTRPGEAAIGIVKISGEDSIKIAEKIFRSEGRKKISNMKTYTMLYGRIVEEDGSIVDEVSFAESPARYCGNKLPWRNYCCKQSVRTMS